MLDEFSKKTLYFWSAISGITRGRTLGLRERSCVKRHAGSRVGDFETDVRIACVGHSAFGEVCAGHEGQLLSARPAPSARFAQSIIFGVVYRLICLIHSASDLFTRK